MIIQNRTEESTSALMYFQSLVRSISRMSNI